MHMTSAVSWEYAFNQERSYINKWSTTLRQHGYHVLKGDPGADVVHENSSAHATHAVHK
jgi:hypothetical protein